MICIKKIVKSLGCLSFVFCLGCLESLQLTPEPSCNFSQVAKQRRSWAGRVPVDVFVEQGISSSNLGILTKAVASIEGALGKRLFNLVSGVVLEAKWKEQWVRRGILPRDGKTSIYWMSEWSPFFRGRQANTRLILSGLRIVEADLLMNQAYYDFFLISTPCLTFNSQSKCFDLQALYTHELLHILGLLHITDPTSVMQPQLPSGAQPQRRQLSSLDIQNLRCEY